MELEGKKGLLFTAQSRRTCSVRTGCCRLPVLTEFRGRFGPKKVVLGHKIRSFGRARPDLAPPPRGATGEFLAENLDLATLAARGGGAKSGGVLPNLHGYVPKAPTFRPKEPQNPGKTPKRRETVAKLHVQCHFPVLKSPLVPFDSTICPRNGPKRRQKAPKAAPCAPTPRNQAWAVSWATWLPIRFRGHLVHPQPPTFCGFQASESPDETPKASYQWSFGGAGGQPGPRTVGANGGSTRVPEAKEFFFQSCS